jgi:hypothetical protein
MAKQPIILSEEIIPPPALVRAGLETLPAIIRAQGERGQPPFYRILYRDHPQSQYPDGVRARGKTLLRLVR